ncbi:protein MAIN-LIKE 2-like [Glycine soja]|uniref:protein MAIN-LIKE 2-like n=1 Tax=Glycine soja TaxID=3848 RepID=UPI00103CB3B5|nr:protein MAIN-LIKE 2-like [Glycine soja]
MPAPHPLIKPLLVHTGFADVAKLRHFKIDHHLVTALVERWRPEKHTFHHPVRECTITLEDVALQLGIRVDGRPITSATYYDWEEICEQYLGVVPPKGEAIVGSAIKLKWLQDNMPSLPSESTQQQLEAHCRAYILWLIGGVLMPNKTGNRVHLMYLTFLADLDRVRRYSWGFACLATLYREMCRVTNLDAKTMGGCASLLQYWAWYRMPFIAARVNRTPSYPLVTR